MSAENEIHAAARFHGALQDAVVQIRDDVSLEEPGLAAFLLMASMGASMASEPIDPEVFERGARLLDEGALKAAFDATTVILNQLTEQREILLVEHGRRKGAKENH